MRKNLQRLAERARAEVKREQRRARDRRRYERARHWYTELVDLLGGHCELCGSCDDLAVDHMDGRDYQPRRLSFFHRTILYWMELFDGVRLRILCRACNGGYRPPPFDPASLFERKRPAPQLELLT